MQKSLIGYQRPVLLLVIKLYNRLWQMHEIKLTTKVAVYKAVVLSVLLYGCESWTLLRRNLKSLESFHLRSLLRICGIQWTDYIPNTEVLSRCNISGIESFVMKCQFRWAGHMSRIDSSRPFTLSSSQHNVSKWGQPVNISFKSCWIPIYILLSRSPPTFVIALDLTLFQVNTPVHGCGQSPTPT